MHPLFFTFNFIFWKFYTSIKTDQNNNSKHFYVGMFAIISKNAINTVLIIIVQTFDN